MGLFSFLTGKTKKTNLTPAIDYPGQGQLFFTSPGASQGGFSLRDFAAKRIRGEGLGFGDDYVSKTTNPVASSLRRQFRNITSPFISNQYSSRGLSRSNLAADAQGKAEGDVESNIGDLMANFYQLNEAQKKTDETQALNLAQNLQGQEAGMLADIAGASERQVGRNIAGDQYQDRSKAEAGGRLVQALGSLVGGPVGASLTGSGGVQKPVGQQVQGLFSRGSSGVKTQLLGSSNADFESWLNSFLG